MLTVTPLSGAKPLKPKKKKSGNNWKKSGGMYNRCMSRKKTFHQLQILKRISSEKVEKAIAQINEALKDKKASSEVKKKLKYAAKNWPVNLSKYEKQERDTSRTQQLF